MWGSGFVTSNLLFSMNWGGRLQAHSQWDNNGESGFDSQMKVLKRVTRRIEPRRTQRLILTLPLKLLLCPSGNMIFLFSPPLQSVWNTGQPRDCSVNLSCRATPLFPILQLFTRRQILSKAEMIHHAAEFAINSQFSLWCQRYGLDRTGISAGEFHIVPSHLWISWCSQVNCRRMDEWPKLDGCWLLSSLVGDSPFVSYYAAALHPLVSLRRGRSPAACERMNARACDFTIAKRTPCLSW